MLQLAPTAAMWDHWVKQLRFPQAEPTTDVNADHGPRQKNAAVCLLMNKAHLYPLTSSTCTDGGPAAGLRAIDEAPPIFGFLPRRNRFWSCWDLGFADLSHNAQSVQYSAEHCKSTRCLLACRDTEKPARVTMKCT